MFANTCLGAAREIFAGQIKRGLRLVDPSEECRKMKVAARAMRLPEADTFKRIVADMEAQDRKFSTSTSRMVRFLAYSGLRISEARAIAWEDFEGSGDGMQMVVKGAKGRGGVAKFRRVPVIAPLAELLAEMRADLARVGIAARGALWHISSPRFALQNACKRLGLDHIRVHDLRHLFATQCIESGVDIPTVARWLGHSDGGALAMRTYGHLRDAHSLAAARRVKF
jgi:integrase